MTFLDWFVFVVYLALAAAIGFWAGRNQKSGRDYFLGSRQVPWWAAMLSLVATETSAVTVVAIPAMMFSATGNFGFLQCALGFALGKVLIALFILPGYFKREITTPYEFLGYRLGGAGQRLGSLLFMAALFVGAAFRVYVGAIPIREAAGLNLHVSLLVIALLAIAYTLMGGLRAVIYTDVFQMLLFLVGGAVTLGIVVENIPGGFGAFWTEAAAAGKTALWDTGFRRTDSGGFAYDWTAAHTVFAGFIGATFVTLATHGTDHSNLQRLLACQSLAKARLALVVSAFVVTLQFALFLTVGAAVFVFTDSGAALPELESNNSILPYFIVHHLPAGLSGLLIAGIFAAAMSTVDSALSALSATSLKDFRKRPDGEGVEYDRRELRLARYYVLGWGVLLWLGAEGASRLGKDDLIGAIFSASNGLYGPLLGLFLIALILVRREGKGPPRAVCVVGPVAIGLAVQAVFFWLKQAGSFSLAWPWVTLVGAMATLLPAAVAFQLSPEGSVDDEI